MSQNENTITLPKRGFKNLLEAMAGFELFQGETEDYLLSKDADFLKKMRKAKLEQKKKRVVSLSELKRKYV